MVCRLTAHSWSGCAGRFTKLVVRARCITPCRAVRGVKVKSAINKGRGFVRAVTMNASVTPDALGAGHKTQLKTSMLVPL